MVKGGEGVNNTATITLSEVDVKKAVEAYVLKSWPGMEVKAVNLQSVMGGDQRESFPVFKQAVVQIAQKGA